MEKLKSREHNFAAKLRQKSTIKALREYITWQKDLKASCLNPKTPSFAPVSINLDLTSACNFSCPFCVDSGIINTGAYLKLEDIKKTIDILQDNGLLSVILLGGGEPTLHKDFGEIINYLKDRDIQTGIVTNGARLDKIIDVAKLLREKDWVRISLDASREKTFRDAHRPRTNVTLHQILNKAKKLKGINPLASLGYSFVIVWEGLKINGHKLTPNIDEIVEATELAREHSFNYISFKPCLIRLEGSQKESLLHQVGKDEEETIRKKIAVNLQKAKDTADDKIKIIESVNLKAMLDKRTGQLKKQPGKCHLQFFRTVVTPSGIFHCPAFRGVAKAKIAQSDGYTTETKFQTSLETTAQSIATFDAEEECQVVGCFYHQVNWWIEDFINSKKDVHEIEEVEDDNFFL